VAEGARAGRAFRHLHELGCLVGLVPEILAHRGNDPHVTRAHQARNESDEAPSFIGRQEFVREQLFELIEQEDESRSLVLQHAAIPPGRDREVSKHCCDRIARFGRGIAQVGGKTRNRLAGTDQFRQAFVCRNLRRELAGKRIE
jgi:hypothetical protein